VSDLKLTVTSWGHVVLDKREQKKVMRSAGNAVKAKTAALVNKVSGSGRVYYGGGGTSKGYRGGYVTGSYRASAAGDAPVRVSGTLATTIKNYVFKSGDGFAVRERAFYALMLETGAQGGRPGRRNTYKGGKGRRRRVAVSSGRVLAPRPSLDAVMAAEAPDINRRIEAALYQGLTWKQTK
jgi:hypothetical protein